MEGSPQSSPLDEDLKLDPQSLHQDQNQQSPECSGPSPVQDLEQIQDSVDGASPQHQDRTEHHSVHHLERDSERHLTSATANQEEGGSVPSLVVTEAEELGMPPPAAPVSPVEAAAPQKPERPSDLVIPAAVGVMTDPILSSGSDGGDMTCSDLMSLRSDSISLASEPAVSRRMSVNAPSSLFTFTDRLVLERRTKRPPSCRDEPREPNNDDSRLLTGHSCSPAERSALIIAVFMEGHRGEYGAAGRAVKAVA
ncbi:uncharacterized protein LOC111578497 [Amphiprion ocellaris]|uniref:uncharacterized protein LOC111578497 n=1 Tax=Amphiprion ocellaris TaxID=80972 RepID=UPI002410E978|nr:uncharacterized protein LOC111578497 [Amphiprion ocellaris]